tara:strand:- start:637 stop:828 length:192 start_codon:yes stop_codon:yes gene_type:complete
MPIYVYECENCKIVREEIQKYSDDILTDCEECESEDTLHRLIEMSSFHLKGGGWYKDGYTKKE